MAYFIANTRILQISNAPGGEQYKGTRKIVVSIIPGEEASDTKLVGLETLTTSQVWSFPISNLDVAILSYKLIEPLLNNQTIAQQIVPLRLVPPGTKVHLVIPMQPKIDGILPPKLSFDIHIGTPDSEPFRAIPGNLLEAQDWLNQELPEVDNPIDFDSEVSLPPRGGTPTPRLKDISIQTDGSKPLHRKKRHSRKQKRPYFPHLDPFTALPPIYLQIPSPQQPV